MQEDSNYIQSEINRQEYAFLIFQHNPHIDLSRFIRHNPYANLSRCTQHNRHIDLSRCVQHNP